MEWDDPSLQMANLSPDDAARFSRHLLLPEIGEAGQAALRSASVLVVGAGGLGSSALLHLTASGIGRIGIVDPDRVQLDNLHRQIIHGMPALGTAKVESARRRLAETDPRTVVDAYPAAFSESNAEEIAGRYRLIVDGSDNLETRLLINRVCLRQAKPMVYGSAQRFEGQISVFDARRGPCYRCVFPGPQEPGTIESSAETGVLGPLPGIIGTMQALEAIIILLPIGEPLIGRLLVFDGLSTQFEEIRTRKNPRCPECGRS
jgi:molybdopterin/thiamine biosynthesis adenylyltransferase